MDSPTIGGGNRTRASVAWLFQYISISSFQATGMVNDHVVACFRYVEVAER
ncbi:MAG: DNA-3-methyladenine glycosylase [Ktedonobacterales bacterium]|nr:MAG: DNA-3-methyladenine glycosylase [Ktedonobacterales bacterium]